MVKNWVLVIVPVLLNDVDPDGDALAYRWWQYVEADTFAGHIDLQSGDAATASFRIPSDATTGDTIHVICEVTDSGIPRLTRYQRVVVTIR